MYTFDSLILLTTTLPGESNCPLHKDGLAQSDRKEGL